MSKGFVTFYPGVYTQREKPCLKRFLEEDDAIRTRGPISGREIRDGLISEELPGVFLTQAEEQMVKYVNKKYDPEDPVYNDEEYAKSLVRHYAAKGYGPYKLRDELSRRGIPKPYWEDALQEAEDPAEIIDALLWRRLGGGVVDQKALKRASDALARRGYSWGDIHAGLRRYGAEIEEE